MAKETTLGVGDFAAPGMELIGAFTDKDATFGAKGSAIGGGVGAGLGAALGGPAGAQIGKMLGNTVGQLIGGAKDKKLATERMSSTMNRKYSQLNLAYNADPYGSGSTFYAEEGLVLPGVGDTVAVNIEKGELLVDPAKMEVIQSFDTKRYKKHAKNKSQEHPGNFIEMDASQVVIPKKFAKAFKEGDRISRRSIVAQIMENQEKNGIETNDEMVYAQDGVAPSAYRKINVSKYKKPVSKKAAVNNAVVKPKKELIAGQLAPTPSLTDMQEFADYIPAAGQVPGIDYTAAMSPDFDPSAQLSEITGTIDPVKISKKPLVSSTQMPADLKSADIKMDPSLIKKPNFLQKLGLADIGPIDINEVKAARSLNTLPTVFGMIQAGQNDPFLQYDENNQFDSAKAIFSQMPVDENIEAARAGVAQNTAGFIKAMRNVNSPAARAEVADVVLKSNAQIGTIEQDAQNRRTQRIGQKLGLLADIEQKQGADRLQARNKFAVESSQDRAARQGMLQSALSEGVTNYAKSVMDDEKIKLGNAILKYNKINPGGADVISEDSGAVGLQIANMAGLIPGPMATGYQVPSIPGVSRGIPIVNGQPALPGIGVTGTASKPKIGAPATAKKILGGR